jgi:O-antigen/teichoic acid export membrane protein
MASAKVLGPSALLLLDYLLNAAGGWVYWLVISKLTTSSEIGQATTAYSLVMLVSMTTQLGLDYTLLKKSYIQQSKILGSTLMIEFAITIAATPFLIYAFGNIYEGSLQSFTWLAVPIFISLSVYFVTRFALLGISNVKGVLIIDIVGTILKFASGYIFILVGFGALGILASFLLFVLLITACTLALCIRVFNLKMDDLRHVKHIRYVKEIISDGLVNTPFKFSTMLFLQLSIVLLAYFGISASDVGSFYIALMISIIAGSLAYSIALMVIPASSAAKVDLSSASMRFGLSLSAPIITALIIEPKFILYIVGPQYVQAETILLILSLGILPISITINAVSRFNNLDQPRKIIVIGIVEISVLVLAFFFLVPLYGTLGAAFALLISFISSSIPSVIWSERISLKHITVSIAAIAAGWSAGNLVSITISLAPIVLIAISSGVAMATIVILKNTSPSEIRHIIELVSKR